ncbi:Fur-regulated basic protein FbpA [Ureibacillus sp. NPDC094379]
MGEILRKAVEDRRKNLINKLITFNVYQKDDKRLWNLTLSELEYEFGRLKSKSHPHHDIGSIKWKCR